MVGTETRDMVPPKSALGENFRPGITADCFTPVSSLPSTLKELRRDRQNRATPSTMTIDAHSGDNVIADINPATGVAVRSYVTPTLDGNVSMTDISGSTYYYNSDERQSVKNLTDSSAAVVQSYDYSAYGDKIDALTSGSVNQRYTYTGRELNEVSGDYYFRYRMYGAYLGGFLQRDPWKYVNGMSMYVGYFARKLHIDPYGLAEDAGDPTYPISSKRCCAGVLYDPPSQCCKDGTVEDKFQFCIYTMQGGQFSFGHAFVATTNLNSGEHHTYGTRRGSRAHEPYTDRPGEDGLHVDYEKKQRDEKGLDEYVGYISKCKTMCGQPTIPPNPGYSSATGNCADYTAGAWNENFPDEPISGGRCISTPGGIYDDLNPTVPPTIIPIWPGIVVPNEPPVLM